MQTPLDSNERHDVSNPLGARALYHYQNGRDTYCRIHGTTDPFSIGKAVSNGCIHMTNDQVVELYDLVPVGTKVVVLDPTSTFSPRS